jgi:histidine triad (HIT) family protein
MTGIFAKIASGEISSYKIAEDDHFFAFLDINPLVKGHTLVIPKTEIDYIFDMDDKLYADFQLFAKRIAKAIKKAIPCKRIGVAVIGLEVPHAHIHLIPLNVMDDINFSRPKITLSESELQETADRIKSFLNK